MKGGEGAASPAPPPPRAPSEVETELRAALQLAREEVALFTLSCIFSIPTRRKPFPLQKKWPSYLLLTLDWLPLLPPPLSLPGSLSVFPR